MDATKKAESVGAVVAQGHYDSGYQAGEAAGRDALIREILEAVADWEKHQGQCYCSGCEVLKPVFREWARFVQETVPRETEGPGPARRRRGRPAG